MTPGPGPAPMPPGALALATTRACRCEATLPAQLSNRRPQAHPAGPDEITIRVRPIGHEDWPGVTRIRRAGAPLSIALGVVSCMEARQADRMFMHRRAWDERPLLPLPTRVLAGDLAE
jgi:hypothetical protein